MARIVYGFWTGNNDITENRKLCLDQIKSHLDIQNIQFVLVTPDNLEKYISQVGVPLHKGYQFLSLTHRADYLRCYFMNFLGGGYTDIKYIQGDYNNAFDELHNNPECYINGYREISPNGVARCHGNDEMYKTLQDNWRKLVGNG